MKKNNLITGIVYALVGAACLTLAVLTETALDSVLFGLGGAGLVPGMMMIGKYYYWRSPENAKRYAEKLENELIEQHDELKVRLRDRAGRLSYLLGLFLVGLSMLVFAVLDSLSLMDNARLLILYLGGYLMIQIAAGIVIFNRLLKKF